MLAIAAVRLASVAFGLVGCCVVDRLIERLDDQSLVRRKDRPLEVGCPREVMVEGALADA